MREKRKRIGIMGGTFDPIHIGHLILGETAYEQFQLDKVLFMPAGNPPHKRERKDRASDEQRTEMVKRAIASNPHFELSLEEMRQAWENKHPDVSTKTLLWDAFFAPQRFRRFQENIGMDIAFRDFYFLLYEGMKKYEEVQSYFAQNTEERKRILRRILERGKERKEIAADVDIESCVMMTLAMQDGILALKVLDETIDDEEKYRYMEEQLWRDIAVQDIYLKYLHGGVNSAVS